MNGGRSLLHRLKSASPQKQEHARLEVENAEDDLVQKTEVAITLMKTVLENVINTLSLILFHLLTLLQPEPIKNLNELAKAQVRYLLCSTLLYLHASLLPVDVLFYCG